MVTEHFFFQSERLAGYTEPTAPMVENGRVC